MPCHPLSLTYIPLMKKAFSADDYMRQQDLVKKLQGTSQFEGLWRSLWWERGRRCREGRQRPLSKHLTLKPWSRKVEGFWNISFECPFEQNVFDNEFSTRWPWLIWCYCDSGHESAVCTSSITLRRREALIWGVHLDSDLPLKKLLSGFYWLNFVRF